MRFVQRSFEQAAEEGLNPPDGYGNWEQYRINSWEDPYYTNGIWVIEEDGANTLIAIDGGEPEDNSFNRDGAWIVGALNKAFRDGFISGYNGAYAEMQTNEGVSLQ